MAHSDQWFIVVINTQSNWRRDRTGWWFHDLWRQSLSRWLHVQDTSNVCNSKLLYWFALKVHLAPKYFFTTIHLCICLKRMCIFFTIFAKSWHFVGFQNLRKSKHHLVHDWVKRGMGLFLIWRHKLFCMHVYKDLMACKSVRDIKSGIDPCPFWLGHEPNKAQFWSL